MKTILSADKVVFLMGNFFSLWYSKGQPIFIYKENQWSYLKILFAALIAYVPTAWSAVDYNIKYSSNYLMPAYVHFKADGSQYSVNAKINIPLYNIVFTSRGSQTASNLNGELSRCA